MCKCKLTMVARGGEPEKLDRCIEFRCVGFAILQSPTQPSLVCRRLGMTVEECLQFRVGQASQLACIESGTACHDTGVRHQRVVKLLCIRAESGW